MSQKEKKEKKSSSAGETSQFPSQKYESKALTHSLAAKPPDGSPHGLPSNGIPPLALPSSRLSRLSQGEVGNEGGQLPLPPSIASNSSGTFEKILPRQKEDSRKPVQNKPKQNESTRRKRAEK